MVIILKAIDAWLDGEAIDPLRYPRRWRRAITAQNRIGWHAFLQGQLLDPIAVSSPRCPLKISQHLDSPMQRPIVGHAHYHHYLRPHS
jgi:hypothetical protein